MAKEELLKTQGVVIEILPNANFKVKLANDHVILAYVSGKMRKFNINILLHDKVDIEMSQYDTTKGRIMYRYK